MPLPVARLEHSVMSFPPSGRHSGAAHHEYCNSALCCRCQTRTWSTHVAGERLCGPCSSCCRECGRAPAPHLDGLDQGLCADCRGLCGRCHNPKRPDGSCGCEAWHRFAGKDPFGYVLNALPQPLVQGFGRGLPAEIHDLIRQELGRRTAFVLRERIERRWNLRWAHALHEKDEDGRRRWTPLEIAEALLTRGRCPDPDCEDGYLVSTDLPCGRCRQPTYRFVPSVSERRATTDHARHTAAEIRRSLLENRTRTRRAPRG